MNHKGLLKNVLGLALILVLGTYMTSCGEDTPPAPTLTVVVNGIDGFTVDIAAEATNATTWSWTYGDGNVSSTVGGHLYTYAERGDFTISCTVTGDGGSVTKTVDVHIATISELLTAHSWVMSNAGANGLGFKIDDNLNIDFPAPDVLVTINSQRSESETYDFTQDYDNYYTFNSDGSYGFNTGSSGNVLSSWVYAKVAVPESIRGACEATGFLAIALANVNDATWSLHENETLNINTVRDLDQNGSPDDLNDDGVIDENDIIPVTFDGINYVTFAGGGFLGMKDYGVTDGASANYESVALINSISQDELNITIFSHSCIDGASGIGMNEPCYLVKLTFKTKS